MVSDDVFVHVADPLGRLGSASVLKPGCVMFVMFPFIATWEDQVFGLDWAPGGVEHLLPAGYHGDPASSNGAFFFTGFVGDVFGMLCEAGSVRF
jgi:hypothetical protein